MGKGLPLPLRSPASSVAPTAPTAADSVGVAMPASVEPRMAISRTIGVTSTSTSLPRLTVPASSGGTAGPVSGRHQHSAAW
jgi:hypothetical protein